MRRGFVLVATLWTVVVVFLLVESIDRSVGDELERMIRVRDRIDDRMDLVATESLVKYYVMTHRATAGGYVFRDENPLDYTNFEGSSTAAPLVARFALMAPPTSAWAT